MITENLSTLKIHNLTKEQYERELAAGRIDENALYLTPYEETDLSEYATQEYVDDALAQAVADVKTDSANKDAVILAETQKGIEDAKKDASNKDAVVLAEAQKGISAVQEEIEKVAESITVKSVNGQIGEVEITTESIGAQPIGDYALKSEIPTDYLTTIPSEYITETELDSKGYLTSYTETDPTVPAWAKQPNKPTYTAAEVGALPADTFIPSVGDLESYVDNKITSKQDIITGTAGQFVVIGADGKPTTKAIPYAEEATF